MMGQFPTRIDTTETQSATGSAGAAATLTKSAPGSGKRYAFAGIVWSYSAAPTGGALTVTIGGRTLMTFDITSAGPGFIPTPIYKGGDNEALVVTLAAPGGAVIGKVGLVMCITENAGQLPM